MSGKELDTPRPSGSSEVVILDERAIAAAVSRPPPKNVNIHKSKNVIVGTKIEFVTNRTEQVVKDLPFHKFAWRVIRNTSRAERVSCGLAVIALIICVILIIHYTVLAKQGTDSVVDKAPHEWNITREMWLAAPYNYTEFTYDWEPLRLVLIQHTVSTECFQFRICAAQLRKLQDYFIKNWHYDIPYNFLIANDGRVYEGRGWSVVGAHTFGYNRCSVGIGFIGDYREKLATHSRVTEAQLLRMRMLLEEGVRLGHLHPDYYILGAKDVQATESPGSNLHNALQKLDHYDHSHTYSNMTCEAIHAMYE